MEDREKADKPEESQQPIIDSLEQACHTDDELRKVGEGDSDGLDGQWLLKDGRKILGWLLRRNLKRGTKRESEM